jgi:mono/diheme cytochrome c family protein
MVKLKALIFARAILAVTAVLVFAHRACAADANNGKRLAEQRCAACHIVVPHQREDVSNSPPFDVLARKYGFSAQVLAYSILEPHPRMNMTLTRSEADDIAAYVATLSK